MYICIDYIYVWYLFDFPSLGGSWTPPNPSASILLIVCLLFALVIYNSYAAFITSVLSVRVASVGSVADVLQSSSFKIGYIKNSADQMYLMVGNAFLYYCKIQKHNIQLHLLFKYFYGRMYTIVCHTYVLRDDWKSAKEFVISVLHSLYII